MKVFISFVIVGMEVYRDAAEAAARLLRHDVLRAEDFPACASIQQIAEDLAASLRRASTNP